MAVFRRKCQTENCKGLTELTVPLQGNAACALLILDKMEDSYLSLANNSLQT